MKIIFHYIELCGKLFCNSGQILWRLGFGWCTPGIVGWIWVTKHISILVIKRYILGIKNWFLIIDHVVSVTGRAILVSWWVKLVNRGVPRESSILQNVRVQSGHFEMACIVWGRGRRGGLTCNGWYFRVAFDGRHRSFYTYRAMLWMTMGWNCLARLSGWFTPVWIMRGIWIESTGVGMKRMRVAPWFPQQRHEPQTDAARYGVESTLQDEVVFYTSNYGITGEDVDISVGWVQVLNIRVFRIVMGRTFTILRCCIAV